ncbi:MAG: hypothetical protein KKE02_02600 [Alphaproteobacteria bacterium]|nr:hypothetical protein [Alphaproteobacteria bacterium]MBU1513432.1 hypothetical protein [Alphaproteobacteria bacterium]MBU2096424.1 hypothetical protein [Alphaproteobacteria bacterium]MBU2149884.1 hypothetical protein [Alphaproteobacteria bacterium]MBU2308210.1 hypothetical protein [Alphaproteobacteria bacterium]
MNEMIERYLAAVGRELPAPERADIVAELRDEFLTQVESREADLGRPLDVAEMEAELLAFGNPLVVAGRYRKVQYLIGPQVFPFWWSAVKATLVVIAAIYAVLIILGLISGGHVSGADLPSPVVLVGVAFGAITLACALVERFGNPARLARWRPERLPPAHGKHASRFELLTELGMGIVFLLWWTGVIHFRNSVPAIGLRIELAQVWTEWFWWILGYAIVEIGSNLAALARPDRVSVIRVIVIWRSLLGAGILIGVIQADQFLIVSGPAAPPEHMFETWIRGGIGVAIALFLARAATEAWRLRQPPSAMRVAG